MGGNFGFMRRGACAAALAVTLYAGLVSSDARAAVITSGCANANVACTLEELAFFGSSFTVGDQTYSDWFYAEAFAFDFDFNFFDLDLALDRIFITPFEYKGGFTGFNIFGVDIGEPQNLDWALSFGFNVSSPNPLQMAGMQLPDADPDTSWSFGMSDLFDPVQIAAGGSDGYVNTAFGIPGFPFHELAVPVFGLTSLNAFTTWFVGAGEVLNGDQGFLPEPGSLALALAALMAAGAVRRRRPEH